MPTKKVINLPTPTPVKASATPVVTPSAAVKIDAPIKNGLCGVLRDSNREYLMTLEMYRHIRKKNPSVIVMPLINSSCWPAQGSLRFRIVSYDLGSDLAYNYYGDFQMSIQLLQQFGTFEEMGRSPNFDARRMGFEKPANALSFLMDEGAESDSGVRMYRIGPPTGVQIRKPVGSYSFYPNTRFYSKTDVDNFVRQNKALLVDVRGQVENKDKVSGAQTFKVSQVRSAGILVPSQVSLSVPVPAEFKTKALVLMGYSAQDTTPLNALPFFAKSGLKSVYILKDGYAGYKNVQQITPESMSRVIREQWSSVLKNSKTSFILDTRNNSEIGDIVVNNSWQAPLRLDPSLDLSDSTVRSTVDLKKNINFSAIQSRARGKKVIVVGENDYDWRPLMLAEALAEVGVSPVYWVREGFEGLALQRKLLLIDKTDSKGQIKKAQHLKKTVKEIASKDPGSKKTLKVIILERKRPKGARKSLNAPDIQPSK